MSTQPLRAGAAQSQVTRRSFVNLVGGAALAVYAAASGALALLFLRPRVTYGPPARLPVGRPADFASGTQVVLPEARLCIRRQGDRLAAISTVCTHLGCTVNPTETGFDCPCHGSSYDERGEVTGGPAPRALAWYRVTQAPSGELVVDKRDQVPADTFLEVRS